MTFEVEDWGLLGYLGWSDGGRVCGGILITVPGGKTEPINRKWRWNWNWNWNWGMRCIVLYLYPLPVVLFYYDFERVYTFLPYLCTYPLTYLLAYLSTYLLTCLRYLLTAFIFTLIFCFGVDLN